MENKATQIHCDMHSSPDCPVLTALQIIGGKWKCIIVYQLLSDKKRFSELQREVIGITQRMLTLQLRELEADGMVHRQVYAEVPPRVEYSLTPLGRSFEPVLTRLHDWGSSYQKAILANAPKSA